MQKVCANCGSSDIFPDYASGHTVCVNKAQRNLVAGMGTDDLVAKGVVMLLRRISLFPKSGSQRDLEDECMSRELSYRIMLVSIASIDRRGLICVAGIGGLRGRNSLQSAENIKSQGRLFLWLVPADC